MVTGWNIFTPKFITFQCQDYSRRQAQIQSTTHPKTIYLYIWIGPGTTKSLQSQTNFQITVRVGGWKRICTQTYLVNYFTIRWGEAIFVIVLVPLDQCSWQGKLPWKNLKTHMETSISERVSISFFDRGSIWWYSVQEPKCIMQIYFRILKQETANFSRKCQRAKMLSFAILSILLQLLSSLPGVWMKP